MLSKLLICNRFEVMRAHEIAEHEILELRMKVGQPDKKRSWASSEGYTEGVYAEAHTANRLGA